MASTWGSNTWSSNSFGSDNNIISVTGIGATFSLGDESSQANADVIPTSLPITLSSNLDVTFDIGAAPGVSGFGTTFNLGTADAGPDAMVTGLDTVTASVGTVDAYNIEGWGRQQWNTFAWGITGSLLTTGEEATANVGSIAQVTGNASVIPTGIPITSSLGDESIEISFEIELGSFGLTSNLGTADAGPDAMLEGIGATGSVGSVEAYNLEGWGRYFWGQFEWGATGEWANVDVTGIEMSAATNPEGIPSFTAEADAQLSTAQAKFGPSSLLLDGTGDFVQSTATDVVQNDFTIEFFAYASNFAQDAYLWDNQSSNQGFAFSITSAGQLRLIQDGTILQQTGTPSLNNNQWNHFALVQNSTLLTLYINGTPKLQYSTGGDSYPGQSYKIGTNEGETQFFNGYIDEFRSSDIARYTGLFTPPTSAFTADGNTISLLHFDGINGSTNIVNSTGSDIPRIALGLGQGQAELEAVTIANVTGQALEVGLRNAVAGASAEIFPTGVQANIALGNEVSQIWRFVDTGTTVSYTEVSTGTSVTWNDIDTAA